MAFLVAPRIDGTWRFAVAARGDDDCHAPSGNGLDQLVAVVALIAHERAGTLRRPGQQEVGLSDFAGLPTRECELQGVDQGIREGVHLGAKAAARPPQGFGLGRAPRGTRRTGMGAREGGVD